MTIHEFEIDGGKDYPDGKPDWPHMLYLKGTREQALKLARDLINLALVDNTVSLPLMGHLRKAP